MKLLLQDSDSIQLLFVQDRIAQIATLTMSSSCQAATSAFHWVCRMRCCIKTHASEAVQAQVQIVWLLLSD
jgi:hypothetical protein